MDKFDRFNVTGLHEIDGTSGTLAPAGVMSDMLSDSSFDNMQVTVIDIEFNPSNPDSASRANTLAAGLKGELDGSGIEVRMQKVNAEALNNNNVQVTVHAQGFKNGS